jgi:hypothetical protein
MPRKISSGKVGRPVLGDIFAQDNSIRSVETNANLVLQPDGTGVVESASDIQTNAQAGIRFADSDSSNYVKLAGPATVASNFTLTLPSADGAANAVLKTDGSGNLSFAATSLTVTNRTAADTNTYFLTMSDGTTGTEDTLSVADSNRLQFVPNPGRLTTQELVVARNTASSSTSTGALVVTGGVGIGGQMTAVSIVETSSIALKENINPIQNGLESILQLKGVTYDRIDNNEHESGLIAEWTEEVLPELVTRDTNGDVVGIKYTKLTAYLIEAIKSLKTEIDVLKEK